MSRELPPQRELRMVVVGANLSHKTSVINTLLGQAGLEVGKRTASCVRREGEFMDRKLILIDTPGWWRDYMSTDTAEFIKQEFVLSVTKCPPGPHVFILVIGTDAPFTEKNRRSVEDHLGLFGETVWKHTIVVFTRGEYLEDKSSEQHVETQGEALKWLVEKCGNRCHMFYSDSREGYKEVSKLLDQINGIVAKNGNNSFEVDEERLREVEGKRNTHRERAKMRQQKIMDQRETPHASGVVPSLPELRFLLLGWKASGKTSAKNTILGVKAVKRARSFRSERTSGEVSGRRVSVVDTPSWWKYLPAKCTPEWVKKELQGGLTLDSKAPHAILLVVPADTTFREEQRKITEDNMKMFGEQVWRHTMVLFTCGDLLGDTSIEEHIESEGEPLQWLIEKCGNRYHVLSWNDKEEKVKELLRKTEEMVASNSLFSPEPETQIMVVEGTTEEQEDVQRQMACLLDEKWQRMDKEMEEKITNIIKRETTSSKTNHVDFSDKHPSSQSTLEEINSEKLLSTPKTQSSIKESTVIDGFTGHEGQKQTGEVNTVQMEQMREMLEREWSRWEIGITERCQHMLSDLRQSDVSSEADVHDLEHSFRKVVSWMHNLTSGYGSDEDLETEEMV
ncbi:GTPase IMAP family member 8-like isoform X2 [Alosa alosa]|uniref:GTPase IMAP family member 8-like isoform X2 n=1 Tax=Alosa alosa TaxID=278164 RepID=UPI0020151DA8|nr:GTPase IMAP family member 8-like isoform X2 [Alosa alosa]